MGVRETKIYVEETWSEAQSQLEKPVVHIAATAVVKNPWVGPDLGQFSAEVRGR